LGLWVLATAGEEAASEPPADDQGGEEGGDKTKELLEQLTITMVSEVVDGQTLEVRDAKATGGRKKAHIRIGNTALPERGAGASESEHEEKITKSKDALEKLVGKQMIWFKPAPDEHQPSPVGVEVPVIVADVWLSDGRHLSTLMVKQGHLVAQEAYHTDLARNILSAEADEAKQESYKKLEEALRESEKEKVRLAEEQRKAEKMKREPIGISGWIGLGVLGIIVLGSLFNFGRPSKKKVNLNRKKGFFGNLWSKVKGS